MKYNELIQFEALETIIKLLDADETAYREKFVSSYIISEEMADRITGVIIPQLQYLEPRDNKGILVVGNYGTGKSHLMAVISGIAEDASLINFIKNEKVKNSIEKIAGHFIVIREEIGSTTRTLRDIIITRLNEYLEDNDVNYQFPQADELNNHKDAFEQMMVIFGDKFPSKGLLFVVDELLDYLRRRNNQELVYDLSFLREIGEMCKNLKFRFIAGVQEAIFDSTMFSFMGNDVRRVRERFETISIVKEDIKYVVAQRLLKKNTSQISMIKEHLSNFSKFYSNLNEKIDDYVNLFPVHPDYIDTFEALKTVEKREILKSLSLEMKKILEKDVPANEPGLIAFDSYWLSMCQDPSFRTLPDVKAVMDCSSVLESRVTLSLPHKDFKDMALRIIHALSLHRLTTGDIYSHIGATAEELRDRLCLYNPIIAQMGSSEPDKELLTNIETVLGEIYSTVSGQFLTKNRDNNQYYLDLKKNDDYDAKIEQRAATLSPREIDNFYFHALMAIMDCSVPDYRPGFKIWPYELIWYKHNASRSGYLFFGTPNERSTTVPMRDFYIYFLEPYTNNSFDYGKKSDEVFFALVNKDEDFDNVLKLYGGAVRQAETSSGEAKRAYQARAESSLKYLLKWFQDHRASSFNITYQGQTKNTSDFLRNKDLRKSAGLKDNDVFNYKEFINVISEQALESYFDELTPEYPVFRERLTSENRKQAVVDTLRGIASGKYTIQAKSILTALELLDDDKITINNSKYARFILNLKKTKTTSQVINRDEIFSNKDGIEYLNDKRYRLEPEFVIIILAALVYAGEIVFAVSGEKFDAGKLTELSRTDLQVLIDFKHLEQSKEYNIPSLQALLNLLNLPIGKAMLIANGNNDSVENLQNEIEKIIKRIVNLQYEIKSGIRFWDFDILSILNLSMEISSLNEAKVFFESLQSFNSPGKMKNFNISTDDINKYKTIPDILNILDTILMFTQKNSHAVSWIIQAVSALPPAYPWVLKTEIIQKEIKESLLAVSPVTIEAIKSFISETIQKINELKNEYIKDYSAMHTNARLNTNEEKKKIRLLNDVNFKTLNFLTEINILPVRQVHEFKKTLDSLVTCTKLTLDELKNFPVCSHCNYMPQRDGITGGASKKIEEAEEVLEKMINDWTNVLLNNLDDTWVQENMKLLKNSDKELLKYFINSKKLPSPINNDFIIALKEVLSKLDKITITVEDIRKILQRTGGSVTPGELKDCFEKYINTLIQGKDATKVRIVVE